MADFQKAKTAVREYITAFDKSSTDDLENVLKQHITEDYHWRGMHPFGEQNGAEAVIDTFWKPFRAAFSPIQRREDMFFAGAFAGAVSNELRFWRRARQTGNRRDVDDATDRKSVV